MGNSEKYHTFWNRFLALIVDGLILWPLEWIDSYILSGTIGAVGIVAWGVIYSISTVFYYVAMHTMYGQTFGKMAAGVKVLNVSEDRNLYWHQACLRDIVPILFAPFFNF